MLSKIDFVKNYIFNGEAVPSSPMDTYYLKETNKITLHSRGVLPNVRLHWQDVSGVEKEVTQYDATAKKYECIFDADIFNRYLTMHPKRLQWLRLVYNPVGTPIISSAINRYNSSIFQGGSYDFSSSDTASNEYLAGDNFDNLSFAQWIKNHLLQYVIEDPNGVVVIIREDYILATEPAKPKIKFISSDKVLHRPTDKENYLIFAEYDRKCLDNEYYIIDKDATWTYYKKDGVISSEIKQYPNYGYIPFCVLGGEVRNAEVSYSIAGVSTTCVENYYASYLSFIIGELNALCREELHYQGDRKDVIPMRGIVARNCDTCNGTGHVSGDCGEGLDRHGDPACTETCKSCGGCGSTISINQGDTIEINEDILAKVGGNINGAVNWFNPDTNIVTISNDIVRAKSKLIEKKLFIYQSESSGQQSGESKKMDLETATMFIGRLADRLFDISEKMLISICSYIQMNAKPECETVRNTNFQLKDETDLQSEIILYKEKGLTSFANEAAKQLLRKQGNKLALKRIEYLEIYSPFQHKTDAEVMMITNSYGTSPAVEQAMKMRMFGDALLNAIIYTFGSTWFLAAPLTTINDRVILELAKIDLNNAIQPTPAF